MAYVSHVANEQHNPGEPMHWAKGKSIGYGDEIGRHLADRYMPDTDGLLHAGKMAWRSMEFLQRLLVDGWPDRLSLSQQSRSQPNVVGYYKGHTLTINENAHGDDVAGPQPDKSADTQDFTSGTARWWYE